MCRYFSETKEEPLIVEVPQHSVVDNTSAGGDNSQGNQGSHQAEEDAPQKSDLVQEVSETLEVGLVFILLCSST